MRLPSSGSAVAAVVTAVVLVSAASPSYGVLRHKYTFNNGTAADPVFDATQNATSIDATFVNQGNLGQIAGGYADLSNNNGLLSGQNFNGGNALGSFIEIPSIYDPVNNLYQLPLSDAAYNSPVGEASVEMWVTIDEHRDYARLWDFGRSAAGQGESGFGFATDYVYGVAQSNALLGNSMLASTHSRAQTETTIQPATPAVLTPGVEYHIAYTLDANDTSAGPNGTAKLYLDGALIGTAAIDNGNAGTDAIDITFLEELNSWFGRSQWSSDALFDGLYNEIRIYTHELTPAEIAANVPDAGPDLPSLNIDRGTGEVTIANTTGGNIDLAAYSLVSSAGGLDIAGFVSLDGMTTGAITATEISESGAATLTGTPESLGTAWTKSSIEDVQAIVELSDGTRTGALVSFTGTPYSPLDLNTDGVVDVTDYLEEFAPNGETSMMGETRVAAALQGDLDGDFDNDYDDFVLFKTQYNALFGAGALELAIANYTAVPEPSTVVILVTAGLALFGTRRR